MQFRKETILKRLAMVAIGGVLLGSQPVVALEYDDPEGAEVLTRGPVHEAFASAVSYNAEAGIIVSNRPPDGIDELPPDQRPVGDNVTWIPGYWGWDEEQTDFLWISGVWRNLPPGRQWVPGYWAEVDARFQWTSGYWQDAETTEVSYLPEPPRSLEVGPNIARPSAEVTWVSGNWMWNDSSYAWRPGYWAPARQDWIWTPASYRWTHRGYVYVDGYWDYSVARRGVLFAPVRFSRVAYVSPGYYYRPSTVISVSVFTDHLFLRPNYCHYYFGDYYAPRYRDRGYYASYSYHSSRRGFDPIYYHNRWEHRHDRDWERGRREYFEYRRDNEGSRPARTWAAFNARPERERGYMAQRYDRFIGSRREGGQRFQAVAREDRDRMVSQRQEIRKFGRERQEREIRGSRPERGQVARAESRRSPVAGRISARGADAPPKRLEASRQVARRDGDRQQQASRPDRQRQGEGRNRGENPAMANRDNNIARPNRENGGRETANRGSAERPNAGRGNADRPNSGRDAGGRETASRGTVERPKTDRANNGRETANRGTEPRPAIKRETAGRENSNRGSVARPDQGERNRSADRGNGGQVRNNAVAPPVRKIQPERKRDTAVAPPVRKQESPRQSPPRAERQAQPKRQATPQRQSVPQPQRQYKPQNKAEPKRVAPPAVRQSPPARQAQPQRKAQPQLQRQAQPQRQPQRQQAAPSRPQPKREAPRARPQQSQPRVQPQRAPQQRAQQQQPRAQQQQRVQPRQNQARPAQRSESKKNNSRDARRESI